MTMSQDELYEYLTAHDVKTIRIAELMGKTPQTIISCFKHHKNAHGYPRRFSVENIAQLNDALSVIAKELRSCVLTFGTPDKYTNNHGKTYDPGLIEPIKKVGELLNLTGLTTRLFRWKKSKKEAIMSDASSKSYGNISELLALRSIIKKLRLINHGIILIIRLLQKFIIINHIKMRFSSKWIDTAPIIFRHNESHLIIY